MVILCNLGLHRVLHFTLSGLYIENLFLPLSFSLPCFHTCVRAFSCPCRTPSDSSRPRSIPSPGRKWWPRDTRQPWSCEAVRVSRLLLWAGTCVCSRPWRSEGSGPCPWLCRQEQTGHHRDWQTLQELRCKGKPRYFEYGGPLSLLFIYILKFSFQF